MQKQVTPIVIEKSIDSFWVNKAFRFLDRLTEIVTRIESAGLYEKWNSDDQRTFEFQVVKKYKLLNRTEERKTETFSFPMIVVYGWFSSVIVFVVEMNWRRIKIILSNIKCRVCKVVKKS